MFENKFNSKKADPLVEAAKTAMELGQKRRDAIAAVNEEFGVFNRNAVVRENLAAYDARIEQVFNGMTSGNLTESNKENKEKKKEHEEKTGLEHIKKMGGFPGQSLKRTARSLTKEELSPKQKKMASLAGNPNKIDAADLASLRKGAKIDEKKGCYEEGNDGNLANNYPPYDKVTRGDVIAGATGKDQMGGKKKMDEKKGCYEGLDIIDNKSGKVIGGSSFKPSASDSSVQGSGDVTQDSKPVVSPTAPQVNTSGPSAADKAGLASKIGAMREAKLDEVSKRTAISAYREKMAQDRDTKKLGDLIQNKWGRETAKHAYRAGHQDTVGLTRRGESHGTDRLASAKSSSDMRKTKSGKIHKQDVASKKSEIKFRGKMSKFDKKGHLPEETIEEAVSRKHFQQVADLIKGHESQEKRNELASHHASIFSKQNPRFDHGRFHKAAGSTAHEAPKKMEEAKYSAKAARAGEDIGKPGKSFSMIAKKAGERYGSEEKGKKVAGAILAKIRAKHMKEDHE